MNDEHAWNRVKDSMKLKKFPMIGSQSGVFSSSNE
jgi:hypothetical protein